jgi:Tfp pilus assembly protein PilV
MVGVINKYFLRSYVRASTLIEVTVALVIISMVFSLAIMIYLNIQRTGFSSTKLMYAMMLEEAYSSTQRLSDFTTKEYDYEDIIIYQQIERHAVNSELTIVHLEARNKEGKLLVEKKHLFYAPVQP